MWLDIDHLFFWHCHSWDAFTVEQILLVSTKGNVQRRVKRIWVLMLESKKLILLWNKQRFTINLKSVDYNIDNLPFQLTNHQC